MTREHFQIKWETTQVCQKKIIAYIDWHDYFFTVPLMINFDNFKREQQGDSALLSNLKLCIRFKNIYVGPTLPPP